MLISLFLIFRCTKKKKKKKSLRPSHRRSIGRNTPIDRETDTFERQTSSRSIADATAIDRERADRSRNKSRSIGKVRISLKRCVSLENEGFYLKNFLTSPQSPQLIERHSLSLVLLPHTHSPKHSTDQPPSRLIPKRPSVSSTAPPPASQSQRLLPRTLRFRAPPPSPSGVAAPPSTARRRPCFSLFEVCHFSSPWTSVVGKFCWLGCGFLFGLLAATIILRGGSR